MRLAERQSERAWDGLMWFYALPRWKRAVIMVGAYLLLWMRPDLCRRAARGRH